MNEYKQLNIDDLTIWSDNPRHFSENLIDGDFSENDIINILIEVVGVDKMFNLIADIVSSKGLMGNVLPTVVLKDNKYLVYDGNRRISSLKLLKNPSISDDKRLKEKILKISSNCDLSFADSVNVYITDEENALELMDKLHNGEQDGVGLIQWEAFQRDFSLVKRGKNAKYPSAYKVSNIMGYNKKSHFRIPYTDLNRLFGSVKLRECFNIKEEKDWNKENISHAIQLLIKYKQIKGFKAFSRHFNSTNSSENNENIIEFCKWVKTEEANKDNLRFDSVCVEIYENQNYDFSNHNLHIYDFENKEIAYNISDLIVTYFNPNDEVYERIDTSEIGIWKVQIKFKNDKYQEKVIIKKLLSPKIDFVSKNSIVYGNTLNLRELILKATNGYGQNIKNSVIISPMDKMNIVGDVFAADNPIGMYKLKFSFTNVNGEPYSIVKNITVTDKSNELKTTDSTSPLLSFNGRVDSINISPEVNELIREINSLDYSEYKGIMLVSLRSIIELTFDKLYAENLLRFSKLGDLEKCVEEFKQYLLKNKLSELCKIYKEIVPSYHTELNTITLINSTEIASYLNLATHKSMKRVNITKAEEYCKSAISPILVYSSLLLK